MSYGAYLLKNKQKLIFFENFLVIERNLKYYLQGMNLNDKTGDNFYSRSRNEQITSQELVEMAIQVFIKSEILLT